MRVKMTVKILGEPLEASVAAVKSFLPSGAAMRASGANAVFVDSWFDAFSLDDALHLARQVDRHLALRHAKIDLIKVKVGDPGSWRTVLINVPAARTVNPDTCRHAQVLVTGECTRCGAKVEMA